MESDTDLGIGADPNQRISGAVDWTPLALAITSRDSETVEVLLAGGADPNARWCALFSIPGVESKPAHGCNRERGTTPLMLAASLGDDDAMRVLVKHGADPTLRDWEDRTALDYAWDHPGEGVSAVTIPRSRRQ
jgi:ankyrin repeat protein